MRTVGHTGTGDFGLRTLGETVSDPARRAVVVEPRIPHALAVGVSTMDESASSPGSSIQHDAAVAIAHAVLNVIAPCLRPEEQLDALHEFYDIIRAGLQAYEE